MKTLLITQNPPRQWIAIVAFTLVCLTSFTRAATVNVTVEVENLAPENGTYLTPVWIGFHDGNFDFIEIGSSASEGLQRLAEDGNTLVIGDEFLDPELNAGTVNGTIFSGGAIPPIAPGASASLTFTLDSEAFQSRFLSYASMVIPSNDAFIGNENPQAHQVFGTDGEFIGSSFVVHGSDILDAGTETNSELPSSTAFLDQTSPNTGEEENGTIKVHPGFQAAGSGGILDVDRFAMANFKAEGYQVARFTITASAPEPQEAPTFSLGEPVLLQNAFEDLVTSGANLAVNTDSPEVLFTTIDTTNPDGAIDPITDEVATSAIVGFFYNPETLEPISADPFLIVGNPDGGFDTHDVKYNPVSKQYIVAGSAQGYRPNGVQLTLLTFVNPSTAEGDRIVRSFVYEPDSALGFDDVSLAVSSRNGNILLAGERNFDGEGEGAIGALFDSTGNLLTPEFGRLDQIQPSGDEDDPDVVYLENNDVFLYVTNTDGDTLSNRITGSIIQTEPAEDGSLQIGDEQILGASRKAIRQGHPAAFENPFNDELIGAFDYGNGSDGGDIFYFNIGQAPNYILSQARGQVPYFEASSNDPYSHRHPQFAADVNSGVIVIGQNAHSSSASLPAGYAFTILGPDGRVLPGQTEEQNGFHAFVETAANIDNGANNHNVKYDPFSDSFLAVYADGNETYAVRLKVTSTHIKSGEASSPVEISRDGDSILLSWESGLLQTAPSVSGPWEALPNVSSPHTVDLGTSGNQFFRTVSTQ